MAQYSFAQIIKLFFPYHLMLSPFPDFLTPWFVLGIVAYFFVSLSLFLYKTVPFIRRVSKNNNDFSFEFLQSDPTLGALWEQYTKTLITINLDPRIENSAKRTEAEAEDYFSDSIVLPQLINMRYWTAVSGILLALGILGTFLGLTLGIQNFDTSSSENIQKSIETLLAGMSTAFLTSLWGMVFSLSYSALEKYQLRKIATTLHKLCTDLNSKYAITSQQSAALENSLLIKFLKKIFLAEYENSQPATIARMVKEILRFSEEQGRELRQYLSVDQGQGQVTNVANMLKEMIHSSAEQGRKLREYLSVDQEQGKVTYVANMLKEMMRSSKEQEKALKSFSTDLADGIQISSATINALGDKIAEALNARFSETLLPSIDQLNSSVGILQETHKQSSGEFLEATVAKLEDSITRMLDELHNSVFGSSKLEMEALAQVTAEAGKILQSVPESITNALTGMTEGTNELKSLVTRTTDDLQSSMLSTTKTIQNQAEESTVAMVGEVQRLCNSVTEIVEANKEAGDFNALLLEELKSSLNGLREGTGTLEETLRQTEDNIRKIYDAVRNLSESQAALTKATGSLNQYSNSLKENLNQYTETHENNIESLEVLLMDFNKSLSLHAEQFTVIKDGLQGIFVQVDQGLKGYEATVAANINSYLEELANKTGSAIQKLAGAIETLRETIDNWEDSFHTGRHN